MSKMKILEKIIKESISNNKYKRGIKEVKSNIKGSKLLILSNTVTSKDRQFIETQASEYNVPIYNLQENSVKLGRLFNKSYRISSVSLKNIQDEDIKELMQNQ